jgi:hypothetical protein
MEKAMKVELLCIMASFALKCQKISKVEIEFVEIIEDKDKNFEPSLPL